MYFQGLHERLVSHIRSRVRSGQITERRLARLTGVSQPHLHHVLKGARLLSAAMADRLLAQMELSVFDLVDRRDTATDVPLLDGVLGPDYPFPSQETGSMCAILPETGPLRAPAMVRLGADPNSEPLFLGGDMALIDRAAALCRIPTPDSWYAVELEGRGFVRRVRLTGERLELIAPNRGKGPPLDCISLPERHILEVVKAKLIWIGRHLEPSRIAARPTQEAGRKNR